MAEKRRDQQGWGQLCAAGKQALDRKDWSEAARRFKQASLRDPDNADPERRDALNAAEA